jgi:hypothetical protein
MRDHGTCGEANGESEHAWIARGEGGAAGALATLVVRSEGWTALGPGAAELVDYVVPKQLG